MSDYLHDLERRIQLLESALQHLVTPSQQTEATTEQTNGTNTASAMMAQPAGATANVYLVQTYGFWSRPLAGAIHTVLNLGGRSGRSLSIASNDERARPPTLQSGDVFIGDSSSQSIWFTGGNIIINTTGNVTANAANINLNATSKLTVTSPNIVLHATTKLLIDSPNTEITGNLTVDQNLNVNGTLTASFGILTNRPLIVAGTTVTIP